MTAGPDPLPADAALPQLGRLLDPDAMAPVLARSLGHPVEPGAVRIRYVSYEPAERLLVHYEMRPAGAPYGAVALAEAGADLAARAADPGHRALAVAVDGRAPAREPLAYEAELDALVQWPPLDLALPALADPPGVLRERLETAGLEAGAAGGLPELVHYKPGRRAVLLLGGHVVKVYASRSGFRRAVRNLEAVGPVPIRTARSAAVVPELLVQAQTFLPGERPADPASVAGAAGGVLAVLHAARLEGLREAPPGYWLASAARSAAVLAAVVPRLGARLERLLGALERTMPADELVPCHGDFHDRQLLDLDGDFGVVDFDRMSLAPPALDLATYVSFVEASGDFDRAGATLDVLAEAYGRRPPGIPWFLCTVLLRRARTPFRQFREGWPAQIEARVALAEEALEL